MMIQLYLNFNRVDLAQKLLSEVTQSDDDSALTQLAEAWVMIAQVRNRLRLVLFQRCCVQAVELLVVMTLVWRHLSLLFSHNLFPARAP